MDRSAGAAIRTATAVSGIMIAFQVASRATRDALFLSHFDVTSLPRMVAAAAAVSLAAAFATSRLLGRLGPARLVPLLFAGSAALQLLEWVLLGTAPRVATVLVYLHINALGALLVSTFWSLVNERFDPRTARRAVGPIGAAGTAGGVAGGLLAERAASMLSVSAMLPLLALLHVACAVLVLRVRAAPARAGAEPELEAPEPAALRSLAASPYLRMLAAVVLLATLSQGLIDYVFKAAASETYGRGEPLLRFFAFFYTGVSLLGIALQAGLGRAALERLGLARTVGVLPWGVAIGGTAAIAAPGLSTALLANGVEAAVRNSLYRSGYELLLTPLPPEEKRAAKPLLDVGAVRAGDVLAAGVVQAGLLVWAAHSSTLLLALAVAFAAANIMLTLNVHDGYVAALERSLLSRAVHLDLSQVHDSTTRLTLARTMTALRVSRPEGAVSEPVAAEAAPVAASDPALARLLDLHSRDAVRVRAALRAGPLAPGQVAQAVSLLSWDEVARSALDALAAVAPRHTGQLVDALLDPDSDFAVRRRVPAALARAGTERAVDGLLSGLNDQRFEVRYRCGRALARLRGDVPDVPVDPARVYAAVLRELAVGRRVWESQRLLDSEEDDPFQLGGALRERASRSLDHVFTVLSLVLPKQPLQIAFRGLHTDDPQLRGTSLEYLETALPAAVRERLWPFLDEGPASPHAGRPQQQVVADLIGSSDSIALNLEAIRRRHESL